MPALETWKARAKVTPYTIPVEMPPPVDPIKAAIDELAAVRAQMKPLEKKEKELSEKLKGFLGDGEHNGNKCIMKITESWPERFDGKAFEAAYPNEYAAFKRKSEKPTRTITFHPLV